MTHGALRHSNLEKAVKMEMQWGEEPASREDFFFFFFFLTDCIVEGAHKMCNNQGHVFLSAYTITSALRWSNSNSLGMKNLPLTLLKSDPHLSRLHVE